MAQLINSYCYGWLLNVFSNQLAIDRYKSCFIPLLTLSRAITAGDKYLTWFRNFETTNQWIGWRENLQETKGFPIKYWVLLFSCKSSLQPIHWTNRFSIIVSHKGQFLTSTHSGNLASIPYFRAMVKINVAFQLCVCWRISENVGTSKFHTLMDPNSCKWVGNCLRDFCSLFFILAVPIFHAICSIWELEPSIVQAICSIWSWNLPFYMLFAAFDSWNCPFRMLFAAFWSWNLPSGMLFASCCRFLVVVC